MSYPSASAPIRSAAESAASTASAAGQAAPAQAQDALSSAASAAAQTETMFSWGGYFQALAVLFLIIALLWLAVWYMKRKGGINLLTKTGEMFLESRMALGPKKSLIVVRFLNKRLLLGVTDQQITMLTELPTDEDDTEKHPAPVSQHADFKSLLDEAERTENS